MARFCPLPGQVRFYVVCRYRRSDGFEYDGFISRPRRRAEECQALIDESTWGGGEPRILRKRRSPRGRFLLA